MVMQCHKLKVVFVFPTRSKWLLSTYQDFARKLVHLHHCHLQIYKNKKSISAGAAQAQQQYKNTISRSADSTSQATVQEHNQQVSRQYRTSNSTEIQRSTTAGTHFCPPPPQLEHACSNISPGWKSGKQLESSRLAYTFYTYKVLSPCHTNQFLYGHRYILQARMKTWLLRQANFHNRPLASMTVQSKKL